MKIKLLVFFLVVCFHTNYAQKYLLEKDVNQDTITPEFGRHRKFEFTAYLGFALAAGNSVNKPPSPISYSKSLQFREGISFRVKLSKRFALGTFVEYSHENYRLTNPIYGDSSNFSVTKWTKQIHNNLLFGVFGRLNLKQNRTYLDLGTYYSFDASPRIQTMVRPLNAPYDYTKTTYFKPNILNRNNYGLEARLIFAQLGVYGRYRVTSLYNSKNYDLPKWMVGMLVSIGN
jgi:hypothetical protein